MTSLEGKNIRIRVPSSRVGVCYTVAQYQNTPGLTLCTPQKAESLATLRFERDPVSWSYNLVDATRGGRYAWAVSGNYPNRIVYFDNERKHNNSREFTWQEPWLIPRKPGKFIWGTSRVRPPNQVQTNQGLMSILSDDYQQGEFEYEIVSAVTSGTDGTEVAGSSQVTRRTLPMGSVLITIPTCI